MGRAYGAHTTATKNNNALAANNHEGVILRASGGSRTRTGLSPLDFESSASASSATLARCGQ
jgi:hypothetical protein